MVLFSIVSLIVASLSAILWLVVEEDVVRACLGCLSLLSLLFTICFAPWIIKLALAAVPFGVERFYRFSRSPSE